MNLDKDINLLFEIGSLRNIKRSWTQFVDKDVENIPEHSFRMIFVVMMIAQYEGDIDMSKLVKMTMIHDLAESRTGDFHAFHKTYCERNEKEALDDMLKGSSIEYMKQYFDELENKSSIEAQIVRDADLIEVDLELKELEMQGNKQAVKLLKYRQDIIKIKEKLNTQTAKTLFDKIHSANPENWYTDLLDNVFKK